MKFKQLNNKWGAEPNAPDPNIIIEEEKLILRFYLNAFIYSDYEEEDIGSLEFDNCYMYRLGATNDEGFYKGQCRFSDSGIKWGEFYLLEDSGWEDSFPSDSIYNNKYIDKKTLKHYLFYFRDETFECMASDYNFKVLKANS